MSWNSFTKQVAEDKANALIFGHRRRIESPAQHAYIKYGKGLRALSNAIDKHYPAAIERAKAHKNKIYIDHLERQGYVVITKAEADELETRHA